MDIVYSFLMFHHCFHLLFSLYIFQLSSYFSISQCTLQLCPIYCKIYFVFNVSDYISPSKNSLVILKGFFFPDEILYLTISFHKYTNVIKFLKSMFDKLRI